jgi:DnaK suppressor protein
MPKTTKVKKKVSKPKAKVVKPKSKAVAKPKAAAKAPIKISKTYVPKDTEKYMCEKHKVFFRMRLTEWKKDLVKANNEALYSGVWTTIVFLQMSLIKQVRTLIKMLK